MNGLSIPCLRIIPPTLLQEQIMKRHRALACVLWGLLCSVVVAEVPRPNILFIFADDLAAGVDIRPTIAITQARLSMRTLTVLPIAFAGFGMLTGTQSGGSLLDGGVGRQLEPDD